LGLGLSVAVFVLRLQLAIDIFSQAMQIISNLLKKAAETADKLISHIK